MHRRSLSTFHIKHSLFISTSRSLGRRYFTGCFHAIYAIHICTVESAMLIRPTMIDMNRANRAIPSAFASELCHLSHFSHLVVGGLSSNKVCRVTNRCPQYWYCMCPSACDTSLCLYPLYCSHSGSKPCLLTNFRIILCAFGSKEGNRSDCIECSVSKSSLGGKVPLISLLA